MMVQSLQEQKQTKSTKGAGIIGIVFHTKDIDSAIEKGRKCDPRKFPTY
jgi:hypothetical protein